MDWEFILSVSLTTAFGPQAIVFSLAAIGLNVHFGYTGLVNFGQVGFLAIGAYTVAMGVDTFGLSFWLCVFLALFAAVDLGAAPRRAHPAPARRLPRHRHDRVAARSSASCSGPPRSARPPAARRASRTSPATSSTSTRSRRAQVRSTSPAPTSASHTPPTSCGSSSSAGRLVALACLFVYLLVRSPWGRVLKAIREDEDAVRSLGKNVYSYKLQSLVIGGVIGAIGGIMFAVVPPVGGARQPRHRAHLLRLRRPRPRRGRPGPRPRARLDDLLLPLRLRRRRPPRGDRGTTSSTSSWATRSASCAHARRASA